MARYEYVRHVRRRSFVLSAVGVPLLILSVFGLIIFFATRGGEDRIGLVDLAGLTQGIDPATIDDNPITLERFVSEDAARQALNATTIDAIVVIPQEYLDSGTLRTIGPRNLSERAESQIDDLLHAAVLARTPADVRDRLDDPIDLRLRTLDGGREISANNMLIFFLPYGFAMLFVMTTFTTSGYLMQAITEEKEGRVIELLATSMSPQAMMSGKIIGLSGVGLTQMLVWVLVIGTAGLVYAGDLSFLSGVQLPWSLLGWSLLFFLLGYFLFAASYTIIGAAITTPQEAQPFATPISLLASLPLFLIIPILAQPNGIIAIVLSLIPFSAPMTMLMRLPLTQIPAWQMVASLAILASSSIGAIWLAARVLRIGMLRYGKRLSLREMFS